MYTKILLLACKKPDNIVEILKQNGFEAEVTGEDDAVIIPLKRGARTTLRKDLSRKIYFMPEVWRVIRLFKPKIYFVSEAKKACRQFQS
jgi:hypothetical protein